ncbi:hypothetical protein C1G86_1235 [Dehalococcoides mccartyi]|uniref:Uncharacterized protein n=1 Tax=Dehalococcoides mccartyi TaxID=61435 RepID=A0A328ENU2_9CHLR|nr:hypothetical protein C1G86_1235 [Dehalococcoides mccartyi]
MIIPVKKCPFAFIGRGALGDGNIILGQGGYYSFTVEKAGQVSGNTQKQQSYSGYYATRVH